ncbi:hypothetical protein BJP25_21245 [Actinokineospora bangkokensis]|uniref:Uncharacterized protein n=1 Tax=Actinokineospora bangkokensis TaxID=1193682 RepID=A0A1Q9LL63_9PSEU|nr:hypothetical protein BJP25_21245 [Actinokineospora bangkokensis]
MIPVLGASCGVGASVLAATLADALQLAHHSVLLVDPSDPGRSGLGFAARSRGPWHVRPHPRVGIRFSWRAQALLAQVETDLGVLAPGMVPAPRWWCPPRHRVAVTVVDLGHDPWRLAAHPVAGAAAWLRAGAPVPRPVLVVCPSHPSLRYAEQVLARMQPWVATGAAAAPTQLVVMGARRWPRGVAGAAGRRVAELLPGAVFVPHHPATAAAGVTPDPTPPALRRAISPLLRRWGLAPDPTRRPRRNR